jgi:hypothetical protein
MNLNRNRLWTIKTLFGMSDTRAYTDCTNRISRKCPAFAGHFRSATLCLPYAA